MIFQVVSESHPFAEFILCADGSVEEIFARDQCSDNLKAGKTNDPKNAVDSVINQVFYFKKWSISLFSFYHIYNGSVCFMNREICNPE